jgi:hypothetical protein
VVLGALALIGLLAGIVLWPSSPKVPDVVGQTESEAERRVGHDYDIYVRSVRVDSLPKGIIMSQDPKAGETAELGSTVSVVVSAGQPPEPGDIFQDDFSDKSSGWDLHKFSEKEGERYTIEYAIGRLRVYDAPDASSWTYAHTLTPTAPTAIEDAIVEVDGTVTTNASESSDTAWGIICRALDYENLYALGIFSDGRPSIWKLKDNEPIPLATGSPSDAFRGGSAKNHLRADCLGSKLTLYANNRMVLKAEDSEFKAGMIGLYVEEHGEGSDILFDNFLVSSP